MDSVCRFLVHFDWEAKPGVSNLLEIFSACTGESPEAVSARYARYGDLKNDVIFKKVFGEHPDVLAGLLNDLLDRIGTEAITELEYLPPDQAPLVSGLKLSILDVRCRTGSGETFIVEMQVLPVTGFLNRVVYNACKAYVGTLIAGRQYRELTDVVAVSICDFLLWADADQDRRAQPRVPMVSRWSMAERSVGARHGMHQVQYVFLELPKLGSRHPETPAERWAGMFVAAPLLDPAHMATEPLSTAQRKALDFARLEALSPLEQEQMQRSREEVDQVRRMV